MSYQFIIYKEQNRIAHITLNRPDKRNAFSHELVAELKHAYNCAAQSDAVRSVMLSANGPAFCAGADLAYLQKLSANSLEGNVSDSNFLRELYEMMYAHPKVLIACVEGPALAGGCGLISVCDFVFASEEASFGYTEARIGFIPAMVMVFLKNKIGEGKARELALTAKIITARQAVEYGLVTEIITQGDLKTYATEFAQRLAETVSGTSVALIKKMFATLEGLNYHDALQYAAERNAECRMQDDCKRGVSAFLNKSKISW